MKVLLIATYLLVLSIAFILFWVSVYAQAHVGLSIAIIGILASTSAFYYAMVKEASDGEK